MSRLFLQARLFLDWLSRSPFLGGGEPGLHTARLAYPSELSPYITQAIANEASLLLGVFNKEYPLRVLATANRSELSNMAVIARTRGGKGLLAKAQILSWTGSMIINDIKGDLFADTAGFKALHSDVFVIDTRGVGHRFDPLSGKESLSQFRGIARYLLLEPDEGQGRIFTRRAINMLMAILRAARIEGYPPFAYAACLIHTGMMATLKRLEEVTSLAGLAPEENLATRFLGEAEEDVNFDSRFLEDAWATLTSKIEDIIEWETLSCIAGSDFTARDIIMGNRPVTLYLRWPERHVESFAPLIRLLWSRLIDDMCAIHDERRGRDCRPVLLLLDEAGRAPIAGLPEYATGVAGRNISIWASYQSLAQPSAIYEEKRANILFDNMDTFLFYRPPVGNRETAKTLEEILGENSRFAHSQTAHNGRETSEGKSEKAVPVLSAWAIRRMKDEDIIILHRDLPPFKANRMDWRDFPTLVKRTTLTPPILSPLPAVQKIQPLARSEEEALPSRYSPVL